MTLPGKLGVRPGSRVLVTGAPAGFVLDCPHDTVPDAVPDGRPYDVLLLFCREVAELDAGWAESVRRLATAGGLWVAWPKRASGVPTDLSDGAVRGYAIDRGLVDVKVCAVDATWSALKMVRRKQDR